MEACKNPAMIVFFHARQTRPRSYSLFSPCLVKIDDDKYATDSSYDLPVTTLVFALPNLGRELRFADFDSRLSELSWVLHYNLGHVHKILGIRAVFVYLQ